MHFVLYTILIASPSSSHPLRPLVLRKYVLWYKHYNKISLPTDTIGCSVHNCCIVYTANPSVYIKDISSFTVKYTTHTSIIIKHILTQAAELESVWLFLSRLLIQADYEIHRWPQSLLVKIVICYYKWTITLCEAKKKSNAILH